MTTRQFGGHKQRDYVRQVRELAKRRLSIAPPVGNGWKPRAIERFRVDLEP